MKSTNPPEQHARTWLENLLLCLVLLAPIALCIALFLPNRDNAEMPMLLAVAFLVVSMVSLFPLELQKDQEKHPRAIAPFVGVCPLCILAISNGDTMAWLFVLLESLCLGLLLCSAAEAIIDAIRSKWQQAAATKAAPSRQSTPSTPAPASRFESKPAQAPAATAKPARQASSPVQKVIPEWEPPRAPRPKPSDITFPVKDLIGEQFARRRYWDMWKMLYLSPREYNTSSYYLEINRLTGELRRVTTVYHGQESTTFHDKCTEQDIRNCGDEKLKDFTAANWQAYVPGPRPRPIPQKPALVVSAEECRPGKQTDVDAYFMEHERQVGRFEYECRCIYLRRCDTGWRLFYHEGPQPVTRGLATDEKHIRHLTETLHTFDRLLTADETAYVMNLLPERHDGKQGIFNDWNTVYGCYGPFSACYWKDGFRVDCAQLPHLPALFEKLAELAERGLVVE